MLAETSDVAKRLGRPLTEAETPRAEGLLEEATALVMGHLRWTQEPFPVPNTAKVVTSRMVARVLTHGVGGSTPGAPSGAESVNQSAGPFSQNVTFGAGTTSGAPWLTNADRISLRALSDGGGFGSVGIDSGRRPNRWR